MGCTFYIRASQNPSTVGIHVLQKRQSMNSDSLKIEMPCQEYCHLTSYLARQVSGAKSSSSKVPSACFSVEFFCRLVVYNSRCIFYSFTRRTLSQL